MKKIFSLFIVLIIALSPVFSQVISLSDSTIIFKDQEGKIITREEAQQLMKEKFSIRQEYAEGKKTITIIPGGNDERALQQAKLEAFRHSLINKPVASFKITDLNSNKWNSKDLKGKVTVINFWFTGCQPCIREMPLLNETVTAFKDKNVVFLAPAPEKDAQIKKFLQRYQFDYNIIPSSGDFIEKMNIENFPTHLIIDKQGIIRQVFIGYSDDIGQKLQEEINKLL